MVTIVTSDNERFEVEKGVAARSVLIKNMIEGLLQLIAFIRNFDDIVTLCRRWRKRPTNSPPQCVLKCIEEGKNAYAFTLHLVNILFKRVQVLEYCEHHRGEPVSTADENSQDDSRKRTTDISEWDQKFITVDQEMLFEIILAANYLDIKSLL